MTSSLLLNQFSQSLIKTEYELLSCTTTRRYFATSSDGDVDTKESNAASSRNKSAASSYASTPPGAISDARKRILAFALHGDAVQGQQVMDQLDTLLRADSANGAAMDQQRVMDAPDSLMECWEALLDAWISHQVLLVEEYDTAVQQQQPQRQHNSNAGFSSSKQLHRLRAQIFRAADHAHQALENTTSFLSRPGATCLYSRPRHQHRRRPLSTPSLSASANERAGEKDDPDNFSAEDLSAEEAGMVSGSVPQSNLKEQIYRSDKHSPKVMLHRCNTVLSAWSNASRVHATTKTRRGIPQRATYLLQRMEASIPTMASFTAGSNTNTSGLLSLVSFGVAPTTESYNRVLEAWAWSKEHLRGTMAEHTFQNMLQSSILPKRKEKRRAPRPNGESYQWIIHAWCDSCQKKSAFTTAGHFMKYMRMLQRDRELGRPGAINEPTMDTYHMVMKAWSTSE